MGKLPWVRGAGLGLSWTRRPQGPRIILQAVNPWIPKTWHANMLSLILIYSKQDTCKRQRTQWLNQGHTPGAMPAWICHTTALAGCVEKPFQSSSISSPSLLHACAIWGPQNLLPREDKLLLTESNTLNLLSFNFQPLSVFRVKKQTAFTWKMGMLSINSIKD